MSNKNRRSLEDGGKRYNTTGGAGYIPPATSPEYVDRGLYEVSSTVMALGRGVSNRGRTSRYNKEPLESIAQGSYLVPRDVQQRLFEKYGYKRNDGDYGLVKRAVGNRNIPVYQKNPDVINRENLSVIGNPNITLWFGEKGKELTHAGYYPSAIYHDKDGNLYQKAWDLNDYGIDENGNAGTAKGYSPLKRMLANFVDAIGSPTVVTTGYQKIINSDGSHATLLNTDSRYLDKLIIDYLNSKGLVKYNPQLVTDEELKRGLPAFTPAFIGLPEVTIRGNRKKHKDGGSIKNRRSLEDGAGLSDAEYFAIMEQVATDNYKDWQLPSQDAALLHALNDNTYDYRGYYNKYPNSRANADTHWTDEFKTVYHPTFSKESKYSGKKSQYNPKGLVGGTWSGETFMPAEWQRTKRRMGGDNDKKKANAGDLIRKGFSKEYAKRQTAMDFFSDDEYAHYITNLLATQGGDKVINFFQNNVEKKRQEKKDGGKKEQAEAAKAANARERNIARQYLAASPNIANLARAAYHWWNSVPMLGGQNESGNIYTTGEVVTPGMGTPAEIARNAKNVRQIYTTLDKGAQDIALAYSNLKRFLTGKGYRERLIKHFKSLGYRTNAEAIADNEIGQQLYNIETAKAVIKPKGTLVESDGTFLGNTTNGVYHPHYHTIQIAKGSSFDVPKHEMIHARNRAKFYLDNERYKMKSESTRIAEDLIKDGKYTIDSPEIQGLIKEGAYYDDIVEQEPRVLNTLAAMEREGYNINNLNQDDIFEFLYDRPSNLHGTDTQSLISNYSEEGVIRALQNFKNISVPITIGGVGYGIYNRNRHKNGGSIYIQPSKRGTFSAAARNRGMGVQEFANTVLRNKTRYSPAMVKKANFARNASKWN